MKWEVFYDRFWDWSESTQSNRISSLEDFGPADEIVEIAESFATEKDASRLIRKALAAGVTFDAESVSYLEGVVADDLYSELLCRLSGVMSWDDFYEHFFDWTEEVQERNALAQKAFGDPGQVCEVVSEFFNADTATRFVKNAMAAGTKFTATHISEELINCVDESFIPELVKAASTKFTEDEFDLVSSYLTEADQLKVAHKSNIQLEEAFDEEPYEEYQVPQKRSGLGPLGMIAAIALGLLGGGKQKDNTNKWYRGRCNGDCAHCPPHFGYRYGRWYFGRHHQYGCQFGGNHGGGGLN